MKGQKKIEEQEKGPFLRKKKGNEIISILNKPWTVEHGTDPEVISSEENIVIVIPVGKPRRVTMCENGAPAVFEVPARRVE